MTTHRAQCSCGQLSATCEGDPVRTSVCHCLACKQSTGSAFTFGARFRKEDVRVEGRASEWVRVGDEGSRGTHRFCPVCGSTVFWTNDQRPDFILVSGGCFADLDFPPAPTVSVYHDDRIYPWLAITCEPLERM